MVAQRLSGYLQRNHLIDTLNKKAGISCFSGSLVHANTNLRQIQFAKKEGTDLCVVFLDLANTSGKVLHNLL